MAAVSETIVREYFELHEFLVRQHQKYITQTRREEDDDIDFHQKSDLLQIIRILKNYDFIREPQLELFKSRRRRK
jgi:hypothetical protein